VLIEEWEPFENFREICVKRIHVKQGVGVSRFTFTIFHHRLRKWGNLHYLSMNAAFSKFQNLFQIRTICTGGSRLMQISLVPILLLQFFKTFRKYLPYANLGLFISFVQFSGQK
jgi:hypothetical protein